VIARALVIWIGILLLASLNGAMRDLLLAPRLGDPVARAISTLALSAIVVLVTWLSIRWIGPASARAAFVIGAFWTLLTLAFEFLGGRYVFGKPWATLLADYDLTRGRIWVLVLVVTLLAPLLVARARGVLSAAPDSGRVR
jgi:hypothetical protein